MTLAIVTATMCWFECHAQQISKFDQAGWRITKYTHVYEKPEDHAYLLADVVPGMFVEVDDNFQNKRWLRITAYTSNFYPISGRRSIVGFVPRADTHFVRESSYSVVPERIAKELADGRIVNRKEPILRDQSPIFDFVPRTVSQHPYDATARLSMFRANGSLIGRCSGSFLYSPNIFVTASHCVHNGTSFSVELQSADGTTLESIEASVQSQKWKDGSDWAVLRLKRAPNRKVGVLEFPPSEMFFQQRFRWSLVAGFPGDLEDGTRLVGLTCAGDLFLRDDIQISGGQDNWFPTANPGGSLPFHFDLSAATCQARPGYSGSPRLYYDESSKVFHFFGIVSSKHGAQSSVDGEFVSVVKALTPENATRIDDALREIISYWKNLRAVHQFREDTGRAHEQLTSRLHNLLPYAEYRCGLQEHRCKHVAKFVPAAQARLTEGAQFNPERMKPEFEVERIGRLVLPDSKKSVVLYATAGTLVFVYEESGRIARVIRNWPDVCAQSPQCSKRVLELGEK